MDNQDQLVTPEHLDLRETPGVRDRPERLVQLVIREVRGIPVLLVSQDHLGRLEQTVSLGQLDHRDLRVPLVQTGRPGPLDNRALQEVLGHQECRARRV